jgi:hypothetical protein
VVWLVFVEEGKDERRRRVSNKEEKEDEDEEYNNIHKLFDFFLPRNSLSTVPSAHLSELRGGGFDVKTTYPIQMLIDKN